MDKQIIKTAIRNGATLAGIASMETLRVSASHTIYSKLGNHEAIVTAKDDEALPDNQLVKENTDFTDEQLFILPDSVRSVLVIGLSHPEDRPDLDWWDGKGTPGNRILVDIIQRTSQQIEKKLKIKTRKLHYYVEKGGIFLKDAAVLAGLGCIGKNNMLITPIEGPMVRLRALFLDTEVRPTGPIAFDPCADCKVYCRGVCPENAMDKKASIFYSIKSYEPLPGRDGTYDRALCNIRMEKDVAEGQTDNHRKQPTIKYCRKCELVCPVGKKARGNHRMMPI